MTPPGSFLQEPRPSPSILLQSVGPWAPLRRGRQWRASGGWGGHTEAAWAQVCESGARAWGPGHRLGGAAPDKGKSGKHTAQTPDIRDDGGRAGVSGAGRTKKVEFQTTAERGWGPPWAGIRPRTRGLLLRSGVPGGGCAPWRVRVEPDTPWTAARRLTCMWLLTQLGHDCYLPAASHLPSSLASFERTLFLL